MDKINIALYGGRGLHGRKESPLRAEEVYCDRYNKCSLYKEGKCLKVSSSSDNIDCKYGELKSIKGYTSKAKKYYDFLEKYTEDTLYKKLRYPSDCRVALIDNYVLLNLWLTRVNNIDGEYVVKEAPLYGMGSWIEKDKLTCDLLYKICNYGAKYHYEKAIREYREKHIPHMLLELKKLMPELYKEFIGRYPEFYNEPDYVGRKAFIKTLVKGSIIRDCHGNKFQFTGDKLVCKEWKLSFVPFDAGKAYIEIDVTDSMTYVIDDNTQADENTIFA